MDDFINRVRSVVVKPGTYELRGGGRSDVYFDVKSGLLTPDVAHGIVEGFETIIDPRTTRLVGGGIGGRLLTAGLTFRYGIPGATILNEEEQRLHCELNSLCGYAVGEEDLVTIVDDVFTTGGSLRETKRLLEPHNGRVIGYCVVLNRGGSDPEINGVPVRYLFTPEDLGLAA